MTDINKPKGAAAEEALFRSFDPYFRSLDPDLWDAYEVADPIDADQPRSWLEEAQLRRDVTNLAWMSQDEMDDHNAQQRRRGEVVTYLTPEQQAAWREKPEPGPHMMEAS